MHGSRITNRQCRLLLIYPDSLEVVISQIKGVFLALLIIGLTALPTQAAKYNIDKKALKKVKKASIISSITLANIADNNEPGNIEFLTQAAEHAVTTYSSCLATMGKWELIDAPDMAGLEGKLADIGSTPQAHQVLTELADKNKLPGDVSEGMMAKLIMASFTSGLKADLDDPAAKTIASYKKLIDSTAEKMLKKLGKKTSLAG